MIKLTLRQMEYFEALVQARHFGRAAEMAGVTQPALSAQIAEMEERLGCRLFERGGRGARLTEEARQLQPRIERILTEARELEAVAMRGRTAMEGRFRLGIIPTVAPYLLPRMLPLLRARFPLMKTEIREAVTDTLVTETLAGRLEGFIAAMPIDNAQLAARKLFADRFFLAVPRDDPAFVEPPVAPEDPALERLMLLEEGHCMREQALDICGRARPAIMANYGATSLTTLLHMVAHGHGVTLIPAMALWGGGPGDISVVPFAEPVPERSICLAWRRNGSRSAECLMLADLLAGFGPSAVADEAEGKQDPHDGNDQQSQRERRLTVADTVRRHVDPGVDGA